jgi:hypothetical protein
MINMNIQNLELLIDYNMKAAMDTTAKLIDLYKGQVDDPAVEARVEYYRGAFDCMSFLKSKLHEDMSVADVERLKGELSTNDNK